MSKLLDSRHYLPLRFGVALGYTIFVLIILLQPARQPVIDLHIAQEPPSLERELWFALGHVVLFTALSALWYWGFSGHLPLRAAALLAFCVALLIGVGSELAQLMTTSRNLSLLDLSANAFGGLLLILLIYGISRRRR
ncbi:MAG: VanZ family protein [Chloroflexi bacterium]|nr:VanZ family protein [Chloroflexota bacterium]